MFIFMSIILLGLVTVIFQRNIDLTCKVNPGTTGFPKTYGEAFDQGNEYYSKGETRGFFYLYMWTPAKTKQCYQLAVTSFSQALSIEPDHRDALTNRAVAYMSLEQYDNAINDYLRVLEINPQDFHARNGIARAYEQSGQLELAALKYEEAIQFMRNSEYWTQFHPDTIEVYQMRLDNIKKSLQ